MSDRAAVQQALRQTLENLQRCGLRWFPTSAQIPADLQSAMVSLLEASAEQAAAPQLQAPSGQFRPQHSAARTDVVDTARNNSIAPSEPSPSVTSASKAVDGSSSTPTAPHSTPTAQREPARSPSMTASQAPALVSQLAGKRFDFSISEGQSWLTEDLDDAARHNLFQLLDQEIRACRKCNEICTFRQQTVFGVGPIRPTVCFMGEAPGADEDRQGVPFVGRAGQLLTRIIEAMKLKREEVYILNSLKCRPPGNRTPSPEEITNCYPFVETQLETLKPRFIVCLGAVAARSLLKTEAPIGQLRGKFFAYKGSRLLVTYHPSYLLRNESAKRFVWEDMQILMRELGIDTTRK